MAGRIEKDGGVQNPSNCNRINSPGRKHLDEDGQIHKHHAIPKYIAKGLGIDSTITHAVASSYHQVVHNHIVAVFGGTGPNAAWRSWRKDRVFRKLKAVYKRFPLPKGFKKAMKEAGL